MSRSLHESFDTAYKGSLKAAARVARRRADRLTVAEALEAEADGPTEAEAIEAAYPFVSFEVYDFTCYDSGEEVFRNILEPEAVAYPRR